MHGTEKDRTPKEQGNGTAMACVRRWQTRFAPLRGSSLTILLALLLVTVFVVPVFTTSEIAGRIIQDVLLSAMLFSGAVAASGRSKSFALLSLVALVAAAAHAAAWLSPSGLPLAIRDEAAILSLALLGAVVGMEVFGPGKMTADRVRGAVVIYILMGAVCADAYQLVSIYVPGAFAGVLPGQFQADRSAWMYFSFVTLTTTGYGDVTPIAPIARSLANFEALVGQLYPAIVLARLVSLQITGGGSGKIQS